MNVWFPVPEIEPGAPFKGLIGMIKAPLAIKQLAFHETEFRIGLLADGLLDHFHGPVLLVGRYIGRGDLKISRSR